MIKRTLIALAAAMTTIALGCVITTKHTIDAHIVLDIRHIEKQADDVLDYVEGKTDKLPAATPKSSLEQPGWMDRVHYAFAVMPKAYAAELSATLSPRAKELADSMRKRQPQVDALKKLGAAGEDNRGYLSLRDSASLSDAAKKNDAQQVISAENDDRKAFYRELARTNADSGATLTTIERVYAQRRLERAEAGDIFQLPPAGDDFDKFKNSATGKKLGSACQANAWVTIK